MHSTTEGKVTECVNKELSRDSYIVADRSQSTGRDLDPEVSVYREPSFRHGPAPKQCNTVALKAQLRDIFKAVGAVGTYNYRGARVRVPSGLNISAWRHYLSDYHDSNLPDYLAFGWPVNYVGGAPLISTPINHATARQFQGDIAFYVATELGHGALAGPFERPPVPNLQVSPLMTRPKRDSQHRRVIMDLSWPRGAAVNDNVAYVDGPATIQLPTVEYMVDRLLDLGPGAYMYKTDLARGYRQLRVDPGDWPLLGFMHDGAFYMDICPPFGLKTSALCMQRTSEAISYIHGKQGFYSRPYLDDFGGAELSKQRAERALRTLQRILNDLGVVEATHKVCEPSQIMIWLGIHFDSRSMVISIPPAKLQEVMETLVSWEGRQQATQREMQSLLGLLQFIASVSPPARLFTNRMLQCLREAPQRGAESLSLDFKKDLKFFLDLLPHYNGVRVLIKGEVECQDHLELDACLTGCGACTGTRFYAEQNSQTGY